MRFQLCTNPDGGTYLKRKDDEEDSTMITLSLDIDQLCAIRDALETDIDLSSHGDVDFTDFDEMHHNYHRCLALLTVKQAIKKEVY